LINEFKKKFLEQDKIFRDRFILVYAINKKYLR